MRLPLISSIQDLDPAPRRFLLFIVFNVVSWQCIVGPALVLFARKIGMPASWVGFLLSFMPFSMLLVIFTVPLVEGFGPKRVMFTSWLLRNLVTLGVFLMPPAVMLWGPHAGWFVIMASTLGFCILRAIGGGGWFPWLHEVVPERQRAAYFSAEASVTQLLNVFVMLMQAFLLRGDPGVGRFLMVYAIGIGAGLASLVWMSRVPGGAGVPEHLRENRSVTIGDAVRDRTFLSFVVLASICFSCTSWYGSAIVLFMRDALGLMPDEIMIFTTVSSVCILLTIRYWARFAEHSGSGRAMFKTLIAHSLTAMACVLLQPSHGATIYAVFALTIAASIFGSAFWMVTHRAMLNLVKASARVPYTTLWTVCTALALGLTPISAGFLIDHIDLWGYRACFMISGIAGVASALACLWLVREKETLEPTLADLLNPLLPVRTLARIVWVTLGLHESNRPGPL